MERRRFLYVVSFACSTVLGCWTVDFASGHALDSVDCRDGLCVLVNVSDPELVVSLAQKGSAVVQVVYHNADIVDVMRAAVDRRGIYGRTSVRHSELDRLPYAENLVNLLIIEDYGELRRKGMAVDEVSRVLAPYGTVWLQSSSAQDTEALRRSLADSGLSPTQSDRDTDNWVGAVKPYPHEMDHWTHFRHSAEGNMVAQDTVVGPPRHVRWLCGPTWQRHHALTPGTSTMVAARGRIFYIQDESPIGFAGLPDRWALVARDAFNGKRLWRRPIQEWGDGVWSWWSGGHGARGNHPIHIRKRLVASDERVFVTLGYNAPVSALDPATGKTLIEYEGTQYADEMVFRDGVLYVSVNDRPQKALPGEGFLPSPTAENTSEKTLWAIEAISGKVSWKAGPYTGITQKSDRMSSMRNVQLVASEEGVFLADRDFLIGLDLKTGKERFRTPMKFIGKSVVFYHRGRLFIAGKSTLTALDAETGDERWQATCGSLGGTDVPGIFGVGDLVWVGDRVGMEITAYDCATGDEKKSLSIAKLLADAGHHHRCYPNKSTVNYLITGRRAAEFTNYETGEITLNHWARGACRLGLMPANGLLYKLPDPCTCYVQAKLLGFYALSAQETAEEFFNDAAPAASPLEKGEAFGTVSAENISPASEWPVFRHDSQRSSSVETKVPDELTTLWGAELGSKLSPPVIAGDRVYVSAVDEHKVYALDARSGEKLWTCIAGGRVDSPPSIHGGMAIFGSTDGWVYFLRASDGELVWQFRAAPRERSIMAYGQVESAWPVHGGVLVANGVVYCTAGRSSFVDGGIHLYALDAATGGVLDKSVIHEVQTVDRKSANQMPEEAPGAGSDILVTDGEEIYMRHRQLDFAVPFQQAPNDYTFQADDRLNTKASFFDQFWFHRHSWEYGQATGNMIAFDRDAAYSVFPYVGQGGFNYRLYVPAGGDTTMIPDKNKLTEEETGIKHMAGVFSGGFRLQRTIGKDPWTIEKLPVGPLSMVLAEDTIVLAVTHVLWRFRAASRSVPNHTGDQPTS